jgi:antitoxin (DNA-binding transcriptional repressor) of toxin-antitoxin stability system
MLRFGGGLPYPTSSGEVVASVVPLTPEMFGDVHKPAQAGAAAQMRRHMPSQEPLETRSF